MVRRFVRMSDFQECYVMTAGLFLSAEIRFSQSQVTVTHDSSQLTPSMTFRGQSCLDKNI